MTRTKHYPALLGLFACLGSFSLVGFTSVPAVPTVPSVPINAFHVVESGFYRGAQPGRAGLAALKELGVRTVVDLRTSSESITEESEITKELGITYFSEPLGSFSTPKDEQVERILELIADPTLRPVFLHCRHGQDRTGMIVGLYRYYDLNWTADEAYQEMLQYGFHPILFSLRNYFFEKTDWEALDTALKLHSLAVVKET